MTGLIRRHVGAVVRGLALGGLAVAAASAFVLHVAIFVPGFGLGLLFLLPGPMRAARRVPDLARRVAGNRLGEQIPSPYRPRPPAPVVGPDGFYEHDQRLYRRPWLPRFMNRVDWILGDTATWRDLCWMMTDPVVGNLLALLPAALVGAGGWLAVTGTGGWWGIPIGIASAVLGVAIAPALVTAHARWTRLMLAPVGPPQPGRIACWIGLRLLAVVRLLALLGLTVLVLLAALLSAAAVLLTFGLGAVVVFPPVIENLRPLANLRRRLAAWSGVKVTEPYRPLPQLPPRRPDGLYRVGRSLFRTARWAAYDQRMNWLIRDGASWRDMAWQLTDPVVGGALLLAPLAAIGYGLWGLVLPRVLVLTGLRPDDLGPWHGTVAGSAEAAIPVGLLLAVLGLLAAPRVLRLHGRWTALLLGPTERARLALRVQRLTESRADATEAQASELRRIERDLHDGAQARLVAVGLILGAVDPLIETDPATARTLLAEARENSAKALTELRDLVRGIHPPVLAERGLGDAVRALALDCPLPTMVTVDLPGRLEAPVESAAYFAVSELMTNAVKHARATRLTIEISHAYELLLINVTDDGRGGADRSQGTGLRGVERRIGTFDGVATVHSPPGGPTSVDLELPCALSSPRTSTS